MTNKKLIGGFLAVFLVAGVAGGFAGYYFPRLDFGSFNPTIDGNFSSSDGWRFSDYQFIEYLTLDENSTNTNNYFYIHLTSDYLYILIDFCGDITGDTTDEWLTVWIDTDNSNTNFINGNHWNISAGFGHQMLCFHTNGSDLQDTFVFGSDVFEATLNSTEVEIEYGFQNTINSQKDHRIFEIRIDVDAFSSISSNNFNIGFLGYGTAAIPFYADDGYWGAPSNFVERFFTDGFILETRYFRCKA